MNYLNDRNYIAIADWMIKDYDLTTRELLTYAIIYGFSQDGESVFHSSLEYLSQWLNISHRNNVLRILQSLIEKGLITKEKKSNASSNWCEYKATEIKGEVKSSDDYIYITPTIIRLGLKDKELLLYAVIHSYSRKGSGSWFTGGNEYLAKWLKIDKSHISRYTKNLIQKKLIERVEENHTIKYRALFVDEDGSNGSGSFLQKEQRDDGSSNEAPRQNDNTLASGDSSQLAKMITPHANLITGVANLITNNLSNNLSKNIDCFINNNSNTKTLDSGSESNSSVVVKQKKPLSFKEFCDYVNADIRSEGNLDSKDLTALLYKNDFDYELYQKYQNSSIDVAALIKKFSGHLFRWVLISWPRPVGNEKEIEELLLYYLTNKRFKGKEEKVNSLSRAQISDLFFTVLDLFDPEKPRYISKTKGAYMIGVIDNVLGQT